MSASTTTFIVIPLFPILVLFYFVMREAHVVGLLALMEWPAWAGPTTPADSFRSDEVSAPAEFTERHLLRQ